MKADYAIVQLFEAVQGCVVQIERRGRPSAAKNMRREWLWIEAGKVVSLGEPVRPEDAPTQAGGDEPVLHLDDGRAVLRWAGGTATTTTLQRPPVLRAAFATLLHDHLN
jgi:hypothetical protein